MGREIKRVPLDFDWPMDEIWSGYLMPDFGIEDCPDCDGRGTTAAYQAVQSIVHLLLMLDDDRGAQAHGRPLHPWLAHHLSQRPSADIAEFGTGLAGRETGWIGHDAIDRWQATGAVVRAAGLDPSVWGVCATCGGRGDLATDEQRQAVENWTRTDPPEGEGWQVWETVSEGSPITPVLPTAEALVEHLATVGTVWDQRRGDGPWRRSAAESFVGSGWAPSLLTVGSQVMEGGRDADLMDAASNDRSSGGEQQ